MWRHSELFKTTILVDYYLCYQWQLIGSACSGHNSVTVSYFVAYYRNCDQSKTVGVTSGTETAYLSRSHKFTLISRVCVRACVRALTASLVPFQTSILVVHMLLYYWVSLLSLLSCNLFLYILWVLVDF